MTSQVTIGNLALGLMGARSVVTSFSESNPEAAQLSLWYDVDRQWLLRAHRWGFASKQDNLTLLATAPGVDLQPQTNLPWPFMPWNYSYAYPSDCVQFRYIIPTYNAQPAGIVAPWALPQPPVRFYVSSIQNPSNQTIKAIFTNQMQAYGIWTADITDPDLFDPQFVEALSFLLAAHLAIPLSGDKSLANAMFQKAGQSIADAASRDGNEGIRIQDHVPDWIRMRGYGADYPTLGFWGPMGWSDWII